MEILNSYPLAFTVFKFNQRRDWKNERNSLATGGNLINDPWVGRPAAYHSAAILVSSRIGKQIAPTFSTLRWRRCWPHLEQADHFFSFSYHHQTSASDVTKICCVLLCWIFSLARCLLSFDSIWNIGIQQKIITVAFIAKRLYECPLPIHHCYNSFSIEMMGMKLLHCKSILVLFNMQWELFQINLA